MTTQEKTKKIIEIANLAGDLGWVLAIPEGKTNHMVLGEPELVKLVCAQVETENYELMEREVIQ
jgi:hypothetical protein